MDIKTKHIVAAEESKITFLIYGLIGVDINGHDLAREIDWASNNYETIVLRINSDGGSVGQGLSIVGIMMASRAKIICHIEGVAASMAAVLPAAADEVVMNDYARIMWHAPYLRDDAWNRLNAEDERERRLIENYRGILVDLLSRRGKTPEQVDELLNNDTWFDAKKALDDGLIDRVVETKRKDLAAMTPVELVARLISDNNLPKKKPMKQVIAKLGLPENADEQAVLSAIAALEATNSKKLVTKYVELGERVGLVTDKNRDKMTKLADANIDLFVEFLDDAIAASKGTKGGTSDTRVSDAIAAAMHANNTPPKQEKTYDWYQRHDPAALNQIRNNEPERFSKLLDEYEQNL
jgi:ATP-dependent protease ClpP protease subunit